MFTLRAASTRLSFGARPILSIPLIKKGSHTTFKALTSLNHDIATRSFAADTVYKFSVSPSVLETVRETLPLVGAAGTDFTKHFYSNLFTSTPSLKNVFNQTNQAVGKQPTKLFKTVALAATAALETGELPGEAIESICQKHCALHITADEYAIVAENLLGTIKEMFTDDPAVLSAWSDLVMDIAGAFITRENEIYDEMSNTPGGWIGKRPFKLAVREPLSSTISRLTFVPTDHKPVPHWKAGKFTTIWVDVPSGTTGAYGTYTSQPRHYTLNTPHNPADGSSSFAIAVKREGLVSSILHDAPEGSVFDLSAPYGCFDLHEVENLWLTEGRDVPVVFLSAGVGITPVMAMLENIYTTRPATWLHANVDGGVHAYRDRVREIAAVRDGVLQRRVWYSDPRPEDGSPAGDGDNTAKFHFEGLMDLVEGEKHFPKEVLHLENKETQYYMCGPAGFMEAQKAALLSLGVSEGKIHSEGF